jgi:hypothetical protein
MCAHPVRRQNAHTKVKDRFRRTGAIQSGCKSDEIPDQAGNRPWARDNSRRREAGEHPRLANAMRRSKNARPSWESALTAAQIESLWDDFRAHESL